MAISYQFLPWVRRGLTVALAATDTLGNLPARSTASSASGGSRPTKHGTPGFRIPAFSRAIAARLSPRYAR